MKVLIPFCPVCGVAQVTAAHILGHSGKGHTSDRKKKTSAANGTESGGRPVGSKDKCPRKFRAKLATA